MTMSMTIQKTVSVGGKSFAENRTITADAANVIERSLPAAKTGTLTTRTDNDTGTLTMTAGHGIITGDKLDIYWAGGYRRTMTVGTVSVNSVPIDIGFGDNLPIATTPITAMVPVVIPFYVENAGVQALVATCEAKANILLTELNDTLVLNIPLVNSAVVYVQYVTDLPNWPVLAQDIFEAHVSHGDSTAAKIIKVGNISN